MHESRLLIGIAALFAGMTALLAVLGVVYNPLILVVAALFGAVTYLLWTHGTGRLAARLYRRVERQAASNAAGRRRRGEPNARTDGVGPDANFGAGPREEWRGPRAEQRARERTRRRRARQRRARGDRAPSTTDAPTMAEAYETLGLDPGADESEVKRAYREKVKEVHPDTEGGDEDRFKTVNRAYERLTDGS